MIFLFAFIKSQELQELDNEELCEGIQPFEDVIEDCTKYKIANTSKVCCYMKLIYDEGDIYSCYPVEKNKDAIKREINMLKGIYEESESINIDCDSFYFQFYFVCIFGYLILFF